MNEKLTTEKVGARIYVVGNSFGIKDRLKTAGCHYDADRKQWWIGVAKANLLNSIIETTYTAVEPDKQEKKSSDDETSSIKIVAKAKYKGKIYYVRWYGQTKDGKEKAHLTTLDGSIEFWAPVATVRQNYIDGNGDIAQIIKTYPPREFRGYLQHTTLGSLRSFINRIKRDEKETGDSPLKYPRTGCSCGSREGIIQDTDCFTCRHDAE